jgi:hypothetical protein
MPRSRNKYSRAQLRAKSRRPRNSRSSRWFYATLAVVVVAGLVGIVLTRTSGQAAAVAPQPPSSANPAGDHWHAAFAVNVCGEWLPYPAVFETEAGNPNIRAGIHTHGDGFIHIHPFTPQEGGTNATLGRFFDYGGWSVSESSFNVWTGPSFDKTKTQWSNGDRCPNAASEAGKGKPGQVVFEVNCKSTSGNPSDHLLKDQQVLAIGFLPKGQEMGAPPNAASAPQNDGTPGQAINKAGCVPTSTNNPGVPDTTVTTAPATTATTTK